jgi:hypothetical protein
MQRASNDRKESIDSEVRLRLKLNREQFNIKWSILSRASSIKAGGNSCNLCLEEKLQIVRSYNSRSNLNKRSEIFMKCVHARRFHAGRFKRTRVSNYIASSKTQQLNRINMLPDDCLLHET